LYLGEKDLELMTCCINRYQFSFNFVCFTDVSSFSLDINPLPKPDWAERAKKQIYRPSYVLNHYVHYSTVTRGTAMYYAEAKRRKLHWPRYYSEHKPSERRIDDLKEATMIHTKSSVPQETHEHKVKCHKDYTMRNQYDKCRVGFAQPLDWKIGDKDFRESDGFKYNCYPNPRLAKEFIPKLRSLLESFGNYTSFNSLVEGSVHVRKRF